MGWKISRQERNARLHRSCGEVEEEEPISVNQHIVVSVPNQGKSGTNQTLSMALGKGDPLTQSAKAWHVPETRNTQKAMASLKDCECRDFCCGQKSRLAIAFPMVTVDRADNRCQNFDQKRRMVQASSGLPNSGGHVSAVSSCKIPTKKTAKMQWHISSIKCATQIQLMAIKARIRVSRRVTSEVDDKTDEPSSRNLRMNTSCLGSKSLALKSNEAAIAGPMIHVCNPRRMPVLASFLKQNAALLEACGSIGVSRNL